MFLQHIQIPDPHKGPLTPPLAISQSALDPFRVPALDSGHVLRGHHLSLRDFLPWRTCCRYVRDTHTGQRSEELASLQAASAPHGYRKPPGLQWPTVPPPVELRANCPMQLSGLPPRFPALLSLQLCVIQQNFLQQWEFSVSALSRSVAADLMWLCILEMCLVQLKLN